MAEALLPGGTRFRSGGRDALEDGRYQGVLTSHPLAVRDP